MRPVTEQVVDFQLQVSDSVPLSVRKESAHQCGRCDRSNLGVQGGVSDTEDGAGGSKYTAVSSEGETRDSLRVRSWDA